MRRSVKAWFASLKNTRLLCGECKEVKQVTKYLGEGLLSLECGHSRSIQETRSEDVRVRQVLEQMDGKEEVKRQRAEERAEIYEIDNDPWDSEENE